MKRATLLIAIAASACSNPGNDAPGPEPTDPRPIVDSLARTQCEKMFDCCSADELETLFAGTIADVDACAAALRTQADAFLIPALEAAQIDQRATLHEDMLEGCAETVDGLRCDDFVPATSLALLDGACPGVVDPGLTLSAFCAEDFECETRFCSIPPGETEGACKNPPAEGEECLNDRCGSGLYCDAQNVCATLLDADDPCTRSADCSSGVCAPGPEGGMLCAPPTNACAG